MSDLSTRIDRLIGKSGARDQQRKSWKLLRRGIDPREFPVVTNDTTPQSIFDTMQEGGEKLLHNDAQTFFDLALHMLTHREVRWHIPSKAGVEKDELEQYGIAERAIMSIMKANDDRLIHAGMQRFSRAISDPALETGTLTYYRQATTTEEGEIEFTILPVNPDRVWVRHDIYGVREMAVTGRRSVDDLRTEGEQKGWDVSILKEVDDGSMVNYKEYWERTFDSERSEVISHGILTDHGVLKAHAQTDMVEIPYRLFRLNGEMYPGDDVQDGERENFLGKSILAANQDMYLEKHDFLKDLREHMREVLTAGLFYTARGRQPIVDPKKLLGTEERTVDVFDIGEGNPGTFPVNPFDQALQFVWLDLEAGRQRGSVPDLLHGNLQVQLSGFAISQVLEASLVQIGEAAKVFEHVYSDLGTWMLREMKTNNVTMDSVGFAAGTGKREYWDEEFSASNLPDKFRVFAEIELARPSDLTERIAQARSLDPSGGKLVTKRTIFETILWDLVDDPSQESEDVLGELLDQLPEIMKINFIESLRHRQKTLENSSKAEDREAAEVIDEVVEQIKSTLPGNRETSPGNQPEGAASGNPPQSALPTEARAAGAGAGGPRGTTANQQAQV